jgi:hypothetical protein
VAPQPQRDLGLLSAEELSNLAASVEDGQEAAAAAKHKQSQEEKLEVSEWGKVYKAGFVPKSSHVANLLPAEEMAKYTSLLPGGQKKAEEKANETKIDASNIGHKLLSKMGWKAGKGLGANESGQVAPVAETKGFAERTGVAAGDMGGAPHHTNPAWHEPSKSRVCPLQRCVGHCMRWREKSASESLLTGRCRK